MSPLGKSGDGGARAKAGDAHSRTLQLVGQSFGEGKHERFTSVINGHQRSGLKGSGGSNIHNVPAAPRQHRRQKQMREMDERSHVHLHHLQLIRQRKLGKLAVRAEAGVVHQPIHGDGFFLQLVENFLGHARVRQIARHHVHLHIAQRCG